MTKILRYELCPDLSGKSIHEVFKMLDPYTHSHSCRISLMAVLIAKHMGISDADELRTIRNGTLYHDIGKIFIPSKILDKPEPLTKSEYDIIKNHPALSLKITRYYTELEDLSKIILQHHEFWDGTGYPLGLKGRKICLGARICCVADSFDAMRSDRNYSKKKSFPRVAEEINRCSGHKYDPSVVEAFNRCSEKLDRITRGR
ncbi:MAG: hypothetical protein A2X48_13980 [Lentisphaerae bacterium GWF2_49_21]|nr:MAG: hypothetical protein A2X48_13980 [Lentisphaerae bacterium GWF2_49_21]